MVSLLFALAVVLPAFAADVPVNELPISCSLADGSSCSISKDEMSGLCRDIEFQTTAGALGVRVCDKGSAYEMYKRHAPSGLDYQVCAGSGCLETNWGFVRFVADGTVTAVADTTPDTVPTPAQEDIQLCTGPYLLDPQSAGMAGESRAANYERLVNAWLDDKRIMQSMPCSQGTCLWVPWYKSSTSCEVRDLQSGNNCRLDRVDMQNNCLVTDEFSQVGMVLAMSNEAEKFDQWVNTVKELQSDLFGTLPVWRAARSASAINADYTKNQDDASDASARVIIALYVASENEAFAADKRAAYKAFADQMSADFAKYDFVKTCYPDRNGQQICNWLASGSVTAKSKKLNSWDFTYGGYFGDVVLAMLAAYKSTGDEQYLTLARDVTNQYLLAANWDGKNFRVPPKAFMWDTFGSTPKAVCTNNCLQGAWDDSDAPRAVSLCKAIYYASLNGVSLGKDAADYCNAWVQSSGYKDNAYTIQYRFDGTPTYGPQRGFYQNGLGAYLNFFAKQEHLPLKIDEALKHFDLQTETFDKEACMGVYRSTFPIISLGSAIGKDTKAFGDGELSCTTITRESTTGSGTPSSSTDGVPAPVTSGGVSNVVGSEIGQLSVRSVAYPGGPGSQLIKDSNNGACRTMVFVNPGTVSQVFICDKNPGFEMYLLTPHTNGRTVTCVDSKCVGPPTAFARW
jgi:hypothetical protein